MNKSRILLFFLLLPFFLSGKDQLDLVPDNLFPETALPVTERGLEDEDSDVRKKTRQLLMVKKKIRDYTGGFIIRTVEDMRTVEDVRGLFEKYRPLIEKGMADKNINVRIAAFECFESLYIYSLPFGSLMDDNSGRFIEVEPGVYFDKVLAKELLPFVEKILPFLGDYFEENNFLKKVAEIEDPTEVIKVLRINYSRYLRSFDQISHIFKIWRSCHLFCSVGLDRFKVRPVFDKVFYPVYVRAEDHLSREANHARFIRGENSYESSAELIELCTGSEMPKDLRERQLEIGSVLLARKCLKIACYVYKEHVSLWEDTRDYTPSHARKFLYATALFRALGENDLTVNGISLGFYKITSNTMAVVLGVGCVLFTLAGGMSD